MKRFMLTTTALVLAGGMAAADTSVTGSAEMGVAGSKGNDAKLHKDIRFKVTLSGATDTGVSFGAAAELRHAGKYQAGGAEGAVFISSAFGTLTLGNTDGAYDKALTETGMGGALTDDDTSHDGYNGNSGLDGNAALANAGGSILRYDYALGNITTSVSGEFGDDGNDSSNNALGVGVAWAGDIGGIGMGIGVGYQTGKAGANKQSIAGASVSVDMGNGIKAVVNGSNHDTGSTSVTHTGIGVAYTAGPLTLAANGGQYSHKGGGKATGAGLSAIYNLGTGVDFKVGAGSGKDAEGEKGSTWSAGLAFSF